MIRHERNQLSALISEADRHEAVLRSIRAEPVFQVKLADGDRRGFIWFSARYVSPLGDSRFSGFIGGPIAPLLLECDTHAREIPGIAESAISAPQMSYQEAFQRLRHRRPDSPQAMMGLRLVSDDLNVAVDVIQGALLALSDHLAHESNRQANSGAAIPAPLELSGDALDVLKMLLAKKAFDSASAVAVKKVAPISMPRRPNRTKDWTYIKAAEAGVRQLRSRGLALATPNVGTWLSDAGALLAKQRFGGPAGSGRDTTR